MLHCCIAALLIFNLLFVALNGWRTKKKKKLIGMNKWYTKNKQCCMYRIGKVELYLEKSMLIFFFYFYFLWSCFYWKMFVKNSTGCDTKRCYVYGRWYLYPLGPRSLWTLFKVEGYCLRILDFQLKWNMKFLMLCICYFSYFFFIRIECVS